MVKNEENRVVVNFSRQLINGVASSRITPTFIDEIIECLKDKITEKDSLHHLTLLLKSPHHQVTENHKGISLEEVYKILELSIKDFLEKEVKAINEETKEEKNSSYCLVM